MSWFTQWIWTVSASQTCWNRRHGTWRCLVLNKSQVLVKSQTSISCCRIWLSSTTAYVYLPTFNDNGISHLPLYLISYCSRSSHFAGIISNKYISARQERLSLIMGRENDSAGPSVSHSTLLFVRRLNQCVITVDGYHKKQYQEPSQGYPPNCVIHKYEMVVNAAATIDGANGWSTWYLSNLPRKIHVDRSIQLRAFLTVVNNAEGLCMSQTLW